MGADEPDIDDTIRKIDPNHDTIFVAGDIEDNPAVLEDTCAANVPFDIRGPCPIGLADLPEPGHQRLLGIGDTRASIEEGLDRTQRYDPHNTTLAWSQFGTKNFRHRLSPADTFFIIPLSPLPFVLREDYFVMEKLPRCFIGESTVPDAIELLKTRRSMKPREMTGPGPSPAEIETILTIGAQVPDHGKLAPWRFILFEGDARVRAGEIIAKVFAKKNPSAPDSDIEIEKKRLTDAPLVIGVVSFTRPHPKVPPWEQELSAGASAMNIVTAATALGYGANWLTGWFAFDRDVLEGLGLKPDEKCAGFIHIGSISKPNEDRPRPILSDIVTRF